MLCVVRVEDEASQWVVLGVLAVERLQILDPGDQLAPRPQRRRTVLHTPLHPRIEVFDCARCWDLHHARSLLLQGPVAELNLGEQCMLERSAQRDQHVGNEQGGLARHRDHARHDGPRVGEAELLLQFEDPVGPSLIGEQQIRDLPD